MKKITSVSIVGGYSGVPEIWAYTKTKVKKQGEFFHMTERKEGSEMFRLENHIAEQMLLKALKSNEVTKTNRQKYARIQPK